MEMQARVRLIPQQGLCDLLVYSIEEGSLHEVLAGIQNTLPA